MAEIEPLGNETLISLDTAGTPLAVRHDGPPQVRRGEQVGLTLLPGSLHWFDATTGARLG